MSRIVRPAFAAALLLACACSLFGQMKRDGRLREQLDAHQFHQPIDTVWTEARKLLADRGYDLVGHDRVAVGLDPQSALATIFAKGFETRDLGGGKRALETNQDSDLRRYRVEGVPTGPDSCRVTFYTVQANPDTPNERQTRDLGMELTLFERLDPRTAERMETAVNEAK